MPSVLEPKAEIGGEPITLPEPTVTPDTLVTAAALWRRLAPANAARLVDAEPIEALPAMEERCQTKEQRERDDRGFCALLFLSYFWSRNEMAYYDGRRRYAPHGNVRNAVDAFVGAAKGEAGEIATRLTTGRLSLPEWQRSMADYVTNAHVAAHAVAVGGAKQVTPEIRVRMDDGLRFQFDRLNAFAVDLADGFLGERAVETRARQYAISAAMTYEAGRRDLWQDLASTGIAVQVRNVVDLNAEHCNAADGVPGCIEESARGWVDLLNVGSMSSPGARRCAHGCRCRLAYRLKDEG